MRRMRGFAWLVLGLIFVTALLAEHVAPFSYSEQFRDSIGAPPSSDYLLGTDELGRDRFSRLLYGTRVSLLLAPAAAALATLLAGSIGLLAGCLGGVGERTAKAGIDLFLSLPWLFLLLTVRAVLPLNASPEVSLVITFALLGLLGWAGASRVVSAAVKHLRGSEFLLQARAAGSRPYRLLVVQVAPNLKPVLLAQFWLSVPLFLLTEANLGLLGLGVAEPLPSWGNLLRELNDFAAVADNPWMVTPAALLLVVVSCFQLVMQKGEQTT